MRIVYYTHPAFFEPALCLVRELSRHADVELLLELAPSAWQTSAFDLSSQTLPSGIIPADPVLKDAFPPGVRHYWQKASGFHLVVHPSRRSLHPSSWRISRDVLRFAADRGSDVLHVDDVDVSPRLALALHGRRSVPIVIAVHDPKPHSGEHNWRKTLARRLAYPAASRFVLYSASSKSEFASTYGINPSNVVVAHLGVYTVFREWATAHAVEKPPTVMFFGRVSPYKGLDVFYTAAKLIAQRLPGVRFIAAGKPVNGYTPPDPVRAAGSAQVEVIDRYLSSAETALLFQGTSVVVCPYRDATQSGVVLTAYAFRVPVVATAVGGMAEYVTPDKTGLLVPVGDPQAIADAVCRILSDPSFAARLREGTAEAEDGELGWHRTATILLDAYSRMARK